MTPKEIILELHKRNLENNPQTAFSQAKTEDAMKMDYRGRFVFEFFQNAADRAEKSIWIRYDQNAKTVVFANDGKEFSIAPCPKSFSGTENAEPVKLDDFHALCSIFTSSKKPGESIGNKGVGFKSCWQYAKSCRIVSKRDGRNWGFKLHNPFCFDIVQNWKDGLTTKSHILCKKEKWANPPSFYFPEPLSDDDCQRDFDPYLEAITVITLEGIDDEKEDEIKKLIDEFYGAELIFLRLLRQPNNAGLKVYVENGDKTLEPKSTKLDGWELIDSSELPNWEETRQKLVKKAKKSGYEIENPRVAIAIPPPVDEKELGKAEVERTFYCYLPTQVPCGFNLLVHADFILDSSRKTIAVGADNLYNSRLLEIAADLYIEVLQRKERLKKRHDAAAFFDPGKIYWGQKASEVFVDKIKEKLWGTEGQAYFLLKGLFSEDCFPLSSYSQMLNCVKNWWEIVKYKKHNQIELVEKEINSHIRKANLKLIPVSWNKDDRKSVTSSAGLPQRDGKQNKEGEAIFLKGKSQDLESLSHTGILTEFKGLAVTSWEELYGDPQKYLGLTAYSLDNVIQLIRKRLEPGEEKPPNYEKPLLQCVIELMIPALTKESSKLDRGKPHCRFLANNRERSDVKLAKNLSVIPLPVVGGGFRRASQCFVTVTGLSAMLKDDPYYSEIDLDRMTEITKGMLLNGITPRDLAMAFGVWECIPLKELGGVLQIPEKTMKIQEYDEGKSFWELLKVSYPIWNESLGDDVRLNQIQKFLALEKWFPLQPDRNEERLERPKRIFRVQEGDKSHLDFFSKHHCSGKENKEETLLDWLGISWIDDSSEEKVLEHLNFIAKKCPIPDGMRNPDLMRSKYKDLTKRLASFSQSTCEKAPLLVRNGEGQMKWWTGERKACWYTPTSEFKIYEQHFGNYHFLLFDEDISEGDGKKFGISIFKIDPVILHTFTEDDSELKLRLREALPDCLAITISPNTRIGGAVSDSSKILQQWTKVKILKDTDVRLDLRLDDISGKNVIGKDEYNDVLFSTKEGSGSIVHDLHTLKQNLWRFGMPLAAVVFGNRSLAPYFESRLRYEDSDPLPWLKNIGILEQDRDEAKRLIAEYEITSDELDNIKEAITDKGFLKDTSLLNEEWPKQWWNCAWYVKNRANCSVDNIISLDQPKLSNFRTSLDPTNHFVQKIQKLLRRPETMEDLAIAWLMDHPGEIEQAEKKKNQLQEEKFSTIKEMQRYRFDWGKYLIEELRNHYGYKIDPEYMSVEDYLKKKKQGVGWGAAQNEWETGLWIGEKLDFDLIPQKRSSDSSSNTVRLSNTKTEEERFEKSRTKSKRGKSVEILYAREEANKITWLDQEEKNKAWELICEEWKRIWKLPGYDAKGPDLSSMPTEDKVLGDNYLRVAKYYDGLGYDVLTVDKGKLVRVEVKSSERTPPEIFLSENERRRAEEYLKENSDTREWRLALFVKKGGQFQYVDVTDKVRYAIQNPPNTQSILVPVDWIIRFGGGESKLN